MTAPSACSRVRSGVGGWLCRVHSRPWPCTYASDPDVQLALLDAAAPLSGAVLAEVAAERLHQLRIGYGPEADDTLKPGEWAARIADYLNRALQSVEALTAGAGEVEVAAYRLRLLQAAAIAIAAVESLDRHFGG